MSDVKSDFKKWLQGHFSKSTAYSYYALVQKIFDKNFGDNKDWQQYSENIMPLLVRYFEFANREYYLDRVTIWYALDYFDKILKFIYPKPNKVYLQRNYQDIYAETNNYFQEKQLATPTKTCAEMIFNAFMRAKIQLLRYLIEFLNGYCGEIDASLIDRMYFKQLEISAELKQKKQHKPDMSLMQVVKHYNQTVSRNKTSDATKERVASKMELIAEIIGKNKPMRQISADDLNDVIQNIPYIPKRFGEGVTKGKTINQAINMAKHNKAPTLSEKTQTDYIQTLSSIFKWAKQKKFIEENPMEEVEIPSITVNRNQDKYLPFSINQLNIIFHSMVYRGCLNNRLGRFKAGDKIYRDGFYWVPLIALFSGMRLNEICQLTTADIQKFRCFTIFVSLVLKPQNIMNQNFKRLKTYISSKIKPKITKSVKKLQILLKNALFLTFWV